MRPPGPERGRDRWVDVELRVRWREVVVGVAGREVKCFEG